jgi:DNA repair protein RecO (recombination protein O)
MLQKTPFIILRKFPFGEKGVVLHVFTEEMGRIPILIKNARSKRSPLPYGLIRPLFLLEGLLTKNNTSSFYMVKEALAIRHYNNMMSDPRRTAIAFFLADIWSNCLNEEGKQTSFFQFLKSAVDTLESTESGLSYFHHWALLQTAFHLGFSPGKSTLSSPYYFDLMNGEYIQYPTVHPYYIEPESASAFSYLSSEETFPTELPPHWSPGRKRIVLSELMDFYRLHVDGFRMPGSLEILSAL